MGKRGPAPKPLNFKGTMDGPGPIYEVEEPDPPAPLSKAAQAEWDRLMPILLAEGKMCKAFAGPFWMLCTAYADMIEITHQLQQQGWIGQGHRGDKKNPLAQLLNDARNHYHKMCREFCITPQTETRTSLQPPAESETKANRFGF